MDNSQKMLIKRKSSTTVNYFTKNVHTLPKKYFSFKQALFKLGFLKFVLSFKLRWCRALNLFWISNSSDYILVSTTNILHKIYLLNHILGPIA